MIVKSYNHSRLAARRIPQVGP